jgi:hypothetical protein
MAPAKNFGKAYWLYMLAWGSVRSRADELRADLLPPDQGKAVMLAIARASARLMWPIYQAPARSRVPTGHCSGPIWRGIGEAKRSAPDRRSGAFV